MENCFSTDADHRESAHKQARQTAHDDLNSVGLDFFKLIIMDQRISKLNADFFLFEKFKFQFFKQLSPG